MQHVLVRPLASHVLRVLAKHQMQGRAVRLDELASAVGVRRGDVRKVITRLDAEGHVDAKRLRLTFSGLALAVAMGKSRLPAVRTSEAMRRVA